MAYKLLAFVIAAAYSGAAGGLLGVMQGYMPPDAFTFDTSGQVIMMTVIGGLETLFGPLVGAAVWLYLRDFLQGGLGLGASWKLVLGLVFVLLISFLRRGILGGVRDLYARLAGGRATARNEAAEPDLSPDELSPSTDKAAARTPPLPKPSHPGLYRTDPRNQGADEAIRRVAREQRHRFLGSARRASRHHRPERRGQEHFLQNAHLRGSSDFGNDHLRRP